MNKQFELLEFVSESVYVLSAVVAVTVMHVLLFVLHACVM